MFDKQYKENSVIIKGAKHNIALAVADSNKSKSHMSYIVLTHALMYKIPPRTRITYHAIILQCIVQH